MTRLIRCRLFCLVLLVSLVVLPGTVFAEGNWLTTDKGHKVWDDLPFSDHTVTWSGGADAEGCATGKGVLQWFTMNRPTYRYEGEMLKGKHHGQGIETFASSNVVFEGSWRDGKMNGYGIWRMDNGDRYEGNWVDGFQHGRGTIYWANGDRYEGDWAKGERSGKGVYLWASGDRYEGQFKNGKFDGKGIFTYSGGRYEGEWANSKQHGKGTYKWTTGIRYEGEWANGNMHGYGTCYFPNGVIQRGQWANGTFLGDKTK